MADLLSVTYSALGDPTRRAIIERLAAGEQTVADLRRPFAMSAPAVSKHLNVLEAAGLITRRRLGRHQICRLVAPPLADADEWCRSQLAFWSKSLDSLDAYLGN